MESSVQNLCTLLARSRLLPAEEVRDLHQRWCGETQDAADATQFTRWLIARQCVTEYQAAVLLRGHADSLLLGQYKLLDRIGKGRMAGVYKAVHPLGQVVAIKVRRGHRPGQAGQAVRPAARAPGV